MESAIYINKFWGQLTFCIHRFGDPINTASSLGQILDGDESSQRASVKLLTRTIESRLVELTINAPDWSVIM
jgi:glycerol-3-phosphate O-acyltransferase / dihydroxyacetone phosphate acyltransferase